jgi:hypothetical protein
LAEQAAGDVDAQHAAFDEARGQLKNAQRPSEITDEQLKYMVNMMGRTIERTRP